MARGHSGKRRKLSLLPPPRRARPREEKIPPFFLPFKYLPLPTLSSFLPPKSFPSPLSPQSLGTSSIDILSVSTARSFTWCLALQSPLQLILSKPPARSCCRLSCTETRHHACFSTAPGRRPEPCSRQCHPWPASHGYRW